MHCFAQSMLFLGIHIVTHFHCIRISHGQSSTLSRWPSRKLMLRVDDRSRFYADAHAACRRPKPFLRRCTDTLDKISQHLLPSITPVHFLCFWYIQYHAFIWSVNDAIKSMAGLGSPVYPCAQKLHKPKPSTQQYSGLQLRPHHFRSHCLLPHLRQDDGEWLPQTKHGPQRLRWCTIAKQLQVKTPIIKIL